MGEHSIAVQRTDIKSNFYETYDLIPVPEPDMKYLLYLDIMVFISTVSLSPQRPPPSQADHRCPPAPRRVSHGLCSDLHGDRPAGRPAAPVSPAAGSH